MKYIIYTCLILVLFSGCGGGSSDNSPTILTDNTKNTLSSGESQTCTNKTNFQVSPIENPSVIFANNINDDTTTITVQDGSLILENCMNN